MAPKQEHLSIAAGNRHHRHHGREHGSHRADEPRKPDERHFKLLGALRCTDNRNYGGARGESAASPAAKKVPATPVPAPAPVKEAEVTGTINFKVSETK